MKILVLSYEYPPIGGGGGVICKNISENLARFGNEVTVLTTAISETDKWYSVFGNRYSVKNNSAIRQKQETDILKIRNFTLSGAEGPKSEIHNLKIIRLSARRKKAWQSNPLEMLSWIRTAKRFIRKNPGFMDFDICMAHFVLPGGEVARWLKMKYGLPYVQVSHGHEIPWVHPRQMFLFHLGAYFWIKKVCMHSDINFIQTKMMKANLDRFLGKKYEKKNVIIPNGVDTSRFFPDFSKRPQQLRVLFVGRLVIQKDPMTFLKALKIFSRETTEYEVHILGDGNLRKKMERYVEKNGLLPNVKFLGKIAEEKMVEEYQSAHLMVAPSLNEGMSISALEALSCGVYLIATRASGFEDMIKEGVNGEYVDFRNPEEVCQKLKGFCVKKEKRVTVPEKNVYRIPEILDWEAISGEYCSFLSTIQR